MIFKESLSSSIAGIVKADYRVPGENLLICCSNEGEVRGFKFSEQDANAVAANVYKDRQEAIRDLAQKKQVMREISSNENELCFEFFKALLLELQNLEEAARKSKESNNAQMRAMISDSEAEIPVGFK